jgi:hypothetical protein
MHDRKSLFASGGRFGRWLGALGALGVIGALAGGCGEASPITTVPVVAPAPGPSASAAAPAPGPSTSAAAPSPSASASATPEHYDDEAGGPCDYTAYAGTCALGAGGTFTFTGKVAGKAVVLKENPLYKTSAAPRPAAGKPTACELRFSKAGTCTPCVFSIGSCGEAALDAFRATLSK